MSQIRERNLKYTVNEDEPPPKKIVSEADILIKRLAEKQRNTTINLQQQLASEKEFTKATELLPLANYLSGSNSLTHFQETARYLDEIETLKAAGLANEDIKLYFDSLTGEELFQRRKTCEKSFLTQQLTEIKDKIRKHKEKNAHLHTGILEPEKHEVVEYGLSVKPESLETKLLKFALENEKGKNKVALPHPMDNIKKIESKLFGYLNEKDSPVSVNKIRRKARKLRNRINNIAAFSPSLTFSESKKVIINNSDYLLGNNSKWDLKEDVGAGIKKVENKVYTCQPQNYYTIREGEIEKLNRTEIGFRELQVDQKLSEEEIRKLPKFDKYDRGTPSNILYIKNISNSMKDEDLKCLFKKFDTASKRLVYKMMNGRMRGQAFITFPDCDGAGRALDELNGTVIRNKPIIIQFGKSMS